MISWLLALAGCHLFEVVDIVCAADEACADAADTDLDTDIDTDTRLPSLGWVISGAPASGVHRILAFDATGTQIGGWPDLGTATGPVAFDPVTGSAYLAYDGGLYQLDSDGMMVRSSGTFLDTVAIDVADGIVYAATGGGLGTWDIANDIAGEAPFAERLSGLSGVGVAADGSVYLSDTDGGAPDLYRWSIGGPAPTLLYTDFDGSSARARIVFPGPDDEPHTCSGAGAFYAVADLAEGNTRPIVSYAGGLTDVNACAFDPQNDTWLLFSPSGGVVRIDSANNAETMVEPSTSYTLKRAGFF